MKQWEQIEYQQLDLKDNEQIMKGSIYVIQKELNSNTIEKIIDDIDIILDPEKHIPDES